MGLQESDRSQKLQLMQRLLWKSQEPSRTPIVYALLDGASDRQIVPMLKDSGLRYNCLYEGKLSYELELSSPYLVRLEEDSDYTSELLQKGYGNNWCIFIKTYQPVTMLSILRLARRNHKIRTPEGKNLIFRYFDPRIIRNYLPGCTIKEANLFFGPIDEIICEGGKSDINHRFTRTDHGVLDLEIIDIDTKNINKLKYNPRLKELIELNIRQEQLEILGKAKLPAFFKRVAEYVINEFPEFANSTKDTLIIWVEDAYNQALEYGLKTERDHLKFINYKCIFGNDFMKTYDFAEPIMQASVSPGLKLARLKDAFKEHLNS